MRVGITGHQARKGIDWSWVERSLRAELASIRRVSEAWSSLAAGSDQVFAQAAFELSIPVTAVIPLPGYEKFFEGDTLAAYRQLLRRCKVVNLDWKGDEERAFYEAGKYIVQHVNILMAVWDGEEAEGLGGTADIVSVAHNSGKSVLHLNPISETIRRL